MILQPPAKDQDQEHRQTVERLNGDNSMNDYCPAGSMKKMNKGKREKEKRKREKSKKRLQKVETNTLKIGR